jgi:glycosyltransferase involved in cell wall biosynthesis
MKVLIDHHNPFLLMHGGLQIQIEQTVLALQRIGVEVDYLRWWDDTQRADIIHFFGRPDAASVEFARQKGIKFVMSRLLTGLGSRGTAARRLQKFVMTAGQKMLPRIITGNFEWEAYRGIDAAVLLTSWEAQLQHEMFSVPWEKICVIPNGVEDAFFESQPVPRGPWLVSTVTIAERKRVVELAEAAIMAQTPLWVIGKPYAESDPYAQRFLKLAKANPKLIRYEGAIQDRKRMASVYREARGFVLLSTMESMSLSASEAAACECPLLLSDLPWAKSVFKDTVSYCPITPDTARTAGLIREFYDRAPGMPPAARQVTWLEVARQLKELYEKLLKSKG